MFVLNELERLLHNAPDNQPASGRLRDIERVSVSHLPLVTNVKLRDIDLKRELRDHHDPFDLRGYISNRNYLTLDILFAAQMKQLVLNRLAQILDRPYPAARVMICDHEAYRYLLKFHYVAKRIFPSEEEHSFLLHKPPFNVTAVLLLSDIVDQLERLGRPLAVIRNETEVHFDYSIIKQAFPYLRITDLVVVLGEIGQLKLHTLSVDASMSHQVIQFLTHFARSTQLIEMLPIRTKLGTPHLLFDDVSVFRVPNYTELAVKPDKPRPVFPNAYLEPTLLQLSFIAHRLQQLITQLEWHLDSITFRRDDPSGFSKIFSQIMESLEKSETSNSKSASRKNQSIVPVRVLVLDRFFDIRGLLRHTDRYGPFLEQESLLAGCDGFATLRLDKADKLDAMLQSVPLTDALKTILEYSTATGATTNQTSSLKRDSTRPSPLLSKTPSQVGHSFGGHAICRHLDIIKSVYTSMNEGYLLLLKLESTLNDITTRVRNSEVDVTDDKQMDDIIKRLERVETVLEQISTLKSRSLVPIDSFRVALLLDDTINAILYLYKSENEFSLILSKIKTSMMDKPQLNQYLDLSPDQRDTAYKQTSNSKAETINLSEKFDNFDAISSWTCGHRSKLSLEQIIEMFYSRKLDQKLFPTLKRPPTSHGLIKNGSRNKVIVLVLGALSHDELTRVKHMESVLMKRKSASKIRGKAVEFVSSDIVIMSSDIIRPDEFIKSL